MSIDETKFESAITSRTKVIVPFYYVGVGCEIDTIMGFASKYKIKVVEDAARGILSTFKGRSPGTISHI